MPESAPESAREPGWYWAKIDDGGWEIVFVRSNGEVEASNPEEDLRDEVRLWGPKIEPPDLTRELVVDVSFACDRAFLHMADRGAIIAMEGDPNRQTGGRWSQEELVDLMLELNRRAKANGR